MVFCCLQINIFRKLFSRSKQHDKKWKNIGGNHAIFTTGATLPAKSIAEQRRHEAQYLALIEATKRQEAKRARQRQQLLEMKRKEEDKAAAAAEVWCSRILPNWENMKDSKRCRELWWRGIPPKVRGHVWSLAIGNELNLTPGYISDVALICTLELIHLDVSRTFPHLGFFQKGGPYEELLLDLLSAYVCYRPDIGYVQSMCFLGAMLLLQIHQPYQSFQAFANLLNRPLMLSFFGLRQHQMTVYFIAYDRYFEQELPKLHHHFDVLDVRPDMYLIEWVYTLYAKSLPFDVCCRVWDVLLRDGEQFIFNTALGIMHLYESELENMNDFDAIIHFLTHLPESMNVNQLFDAIEPFMKFPSSFAKTSYNVGEQRTTTLGLNVCNMKMSKSLSEFLGN
uniref:BMA-TBC-12 n=1 Tax=Brugia malayi TaxID=6279 RepID=A0A0J9Y1I6_BRUMA|nr:BMA-TBC-12 [Brugia malayi]